MTRLTLVSFATLPQWECVPCGMGPFGAFGHAICPKCARAMTPVKEAPK